MPEPTARAFAVSTSLLIAEGTGLADDDTIGGDCELDLIGGDGRATTEDDCRVDDLLTTTRELLIDDCILDCGYALGCAGEERGVLEGSRSELLAPLCDDRGIAEDDTTVLEDDAVLRKEEAASDETDLDGRAIDKDWVGREDEAAKDEANLDEEWTEDEATTCEDDVP